MFDHIETKKQKQTYGFFDWMHRFVLTEDHLRHARDTIYEFEAQVSKLSQMHRTPQSANHHAEGPLMTSHIEIMLSGLEAICEDRASLLQIEEFAREKAFATALSQLEDMMCENAATLKAFILLHDIAKYDVMTFDAPVGSKGAAEGFNDKRVHTDVLVDRYLKLLHKFELEHPDLNPQEIAMRFFDAYQIKVHYKRHAQMAASEAYDKIRETVEDLCRLTARDREVLYLLIRYHMEILLFMNSRADATRYTYLQRLAQKAGLDADDLIDLFTCALILDGLIGSFTYKDGKLQADIDLILNMLRSEELSEDRRREVRERKVQDKQQKVFKQILEKTGLGSQEVFARLRIPFGRERGDLVKRIEAAVKEGDASLLEEYEADLLPNIQQAHLLYVSKMK